jgi:RecA-family ATPase
MGLDTNKDGVLYLALEDGDYRLQSRARKVANGRELPENLLLVKQAPILTDGLLPQISALLNGAEQSIGMIIIDTLQKVRGLAGKTEGVYGYDYRELGQLHQFALDRNIAVVLVHHLNKGGDDSDFVSRLNGSTGVSGAADSIITLTRVSRNSDETKMSITGRDVQERTLIIQMDWSNFRWIMLGEEHEVEKERDELEFHRDPIVKTILARLDEAEDLSESGEVCWAATSQELMDEVQRLYGATYESPAAVGRQVKKLEPKLDAIEGIVYEYRRTKTSRQHVFKREII